VAQAAEHLPSKCKTQSSSPSTAKTDQKSNQNKTNKAVATSLYPSACACPACFEPYFVTAYFWILVPNMCVPPSSRTWGHKSFDFMCFSNFCSNIGMILIYPRRGIYSPRTAKSIACFCTLLLWTKLLCVFTFTWLCRHMFSCLGTEWMDLIITPCLHFWGAARPFSPNNSTILYSQYQYVKVPLTPPPHQHLLLSVYLRTAVPIGEKRCLTVIWLVFP
jgi:hypothetical protein